MKLKKGRRLRRKLSNKLMRIFRAELDVALGSLPEGEELDISKPLTRLVMIVLKKPEVEARSHVLVVPHNLANKSLNFIDHLHDRLAFYIKSERPGLSDEEVWAIVDDLAARAERREPDVWVRAVVGSLIEIATRETLMPTDENAKYLADFCLGHIH